ncbi:HEAT repeat domain-containing protein [Anaeromicropila populeti]|uniref:HEAT repeat-containing protein n=1 Tax=Anaeromicropila populeti TaxID=37658 RepID=A0A1I6KKZ5_9FIRM|nr:hypothetical protein [Anaeromicropila populeti]SFR91877.1 hypothetical protein SAMN05661086_02500 [Anaeromicropila populeti]
MNSDIETLRARGYIEGDDIHDYEKKSKEELIALLDDKTPCVRSSAAKEISFAYNMNEIEITKILLSKLVKEKKLYTRIEIGAALERGGEITAKEMVQYIGKIGKNQHKSLPDRPSKKISFPLPRDFIIRSLARMDVKIMPVLIEVLESQDEEKIAEIFDAIGYIAFYKIKAAKWEYTETVLKVVEKYKGNEVIYWKGIRCLSGFPWQKAADFLKKVIETESQELLVEEAKRSLRLMKRPLLDTYN